MTISGSAVGSVLGALNNLCYGPTKTWPSTYQAVSLWNENQTERLGKSFESIWLFQSCTEVLSISSCCVYPLIGSYLLMIIKLSNFSKILFFVFSIPQMCVIKQTKHLLHYLVQLLFKDKCLPLWTPSGRTWGLIFHCLRQKAQPLPRLIIQKCQLDGWMGSLCLATHR